MPNEKKEDGAWGKVVVGVLVALLAGGTTPWWWSKVVGGNQPSPTPSQPANPSSPVNSPAINKTLRVYADSTKGTPFLNKESGYVNVGFEATGEWLAIPENLSAPGVPDKAKGYLSPKGVLNFQPNTTVCKGAPLGALVAMEEDKIHCKAYGEKGQFELKPGETVYFMMNDVPSLYQDNRGQIDVKLSISKG